MGNEIPEQVQGYCEQFDLSNHVNHKHEQLNKSSI